SSTRTGSPRCSGSGATAALLNGGASCAHETDEAQHETQRGERVPGDTPKRAGDEDRARLGLEALKPARASRIAECIAGVAGRPHGAPANGEPGDDRADA